MLASPNKLRLECADHARQFRFGVGQQGRCRSEVSAAGDRLQLGAQVGELTGPDIRAAGLQGVSGLEQRTGIVST